MTDDEIEPFEECMKRLEEKIHIAIAIAMHEESKRKTSTAAIIIAFAAAAANVATFPLQFCNVNGSAARRTIGKLADNVADDIRSNIAKIFEQSMAEKDAKKQH